MGNALKRVAAGVAGGVMALSMAAVPAHANGAFSVGIECDVPNPWGTTCYATAINGTPNYTWQWYHPDGTYPPSTTTVPYHATGLNCPYPYTRRYLQVNVRDGAGRSASAGVYVTCGWV